MMGEACLEMEDDAPHKAENSRRVAIDNPRGVDVEQLHLKENEGKVEAVKKDDSSVWSSRHSRVYQPGRSEP